MADVIAAIATALAPSAIGVVRLSGDGAVQTAERMFAPRRGGRLSDAPDRKMILGDLLDERGRTLDEILAVVARGPHSYTGEDTVEFQCHGSPAVLAAALRAAFAAGARQAGPGEFTKRAFLNGQMDLTQAEAVADLIEAQTADAAVCAAGQLGGAIRRKIRPVYDGLVDILAHFHAVLDYPDEDIEPFRLEQFRQSVTGWRDSLRTLEDTFDRGRILKHGVKAVILGSPNAGKSSLLNALAGYDRVIVTDVAGTTRDAVEETVLLDGLAVRLLDTAGIRRTADAVEGMGVDIARQAAETADVALFVCDGARPLTEEDRMAMAEARKAPRALAVVNKSDLPLTVTAADLPFSDVVILSAKTGAGLEDLSGILRRWYVGGAPDGEILTNARQQEAVRRARQSLEAMLLSMAEKQTPDAVLLDAEAALEALGELTGQTMRREVVERIFERFCVGK